MKQLLIKGKYNAGDSFLDGHIYVKNGFVQSPEDDSGTPDTILDLNGLYIIPGFVDVHTHLREPGFSYKETIRTGTMAAAAGGYTTVFSMPNLKPCPDCVENINVQLDLIRRDAVIRVYPYAAITKGGQGRGELVDFDALAPLAAGFSDDGKGVQSEQLMLLAMERCRDAGSIIVAHCEDENLLNAGYIHDGNYARRNGHKGIPSESEWRPIERDINLVRRTGCRYHICHVSTKESVELIRKAKAEGLPVTAETAPHYLLLCDEDIADDGRFKMNPPLRSREDMLALRKAVAEGTIDVIATDHAPHSAEEKGKGLAGSMMGIVGLETAFCVLYTGLVKTGLLSLHRLVELMSIAPRKIFGLPGGLEPGCPADFTVLDLNAQYTINPEQFFSLGHCTPFAGWQVQGRVIKTFVGGELVYEHR